MSLLHALNSFFSGCASPSDPTLHHATWCFIFNIMSLILHRKISSMQLPALHWTFPFALSLLFWKVPGAGWGDAQSWYGGLSPLGYTRGSRDDQWTRSIPQYRIYPSYISMTSTLKLYTVGSRQLGFSRQLPAPSEAANHDNLTSLSCSPCPPDSRRTDRRWIKMIQVPSQSEL